ncbi:DUF676-domain-containing protein [Sarocladium strictum]
MLLLHQVGSVKIGEVVRYHVTYTPSQDRILPSPEHLYVRIRNTSAIALRAAFVHGPYTLAVAAWPSNFDPNEKFEDPRRYGVPEFEPMVKAGGSWECELTVPDNIRQSAGIGSHGGFGESPEHDNESASWVIEVSSQVIFSTSAAVGYEVVVARDKKSLNLGLSLPIVGNQTQAPQPGRVADHQQSVGAKDGHHPAQIKGVFSRAVKVTVEDTAALWNTPRLPAWDDAGEHRLKHRNPPDEPVESTAKTGEPKTKEKDEPQPRKQKKVHLVILTHGLHSNLGADMLFMKESIDAAAKQAKVDKKARKARERAARGRPSTSASSASSQSAKPGDQKTEDPEELKDEKKSEPEGDEAESSEESEKTEKQTEEAQAPTPEVDEEDDEDEDDEEVIVRGYSGNATKTERGIKYLGKRLARYVLSMTYPDQPYLPMGKEAVHAVTHNSQQANDLHPSHKHSTIHSEAHRERHAKQDRPYRITSISFIGHSLGGLVQTYAVAYIQKHSPEFFELIKPINFIALATPFLGLSNENPVYVRFALDFGLVGRTGKDLGLAWRAPTIARSGWGALVGNLGETAHKKVYGESQPESKPLLRILPTGPAHRALKKFRNRTAYSNVVNDGIVPLRTSCLLFLDWHGLGRVEKARRDAGLVETMVGFGWAELTGTNLATPRQKQMLAARDAPLPTNEEPPSISGDTTPKGKNLSQVPQPADDAVIEDDRQSLEHTVTTPGVEAASNSESASDMITNGPLSGFFNFFKSNEPPKPPVTSQKQKKAFRSGQIKPSEEATGTSPPSPGSSSSGPAKASAGHDLDDETESMNAPPRTTFFEAAGDLLNPKLPDVDYLLDPSKRPRTIFHDRVYHPSDIPPPPLKKRHSTLSRRAFSRGSTSSQQSSGSTASSPYPTTSREDSVESSKDYDNGTHGHDEVVDSSNMRVEEKIARAYHRDLSWRKVLVKLEPDAHNNMIVRRMFLNSYGWPVVKHIVDAHFSDSAVARSRDEDEYTGERALDIGQPPDKHGGETRSVPQGRILVTAPTASPEQRSTSEAQEALDKVPDLPKLNTSSVPRSTDGKDHADSLSPPTPQRRGIDRYDSATWSDRDFQDSDNDSDNEGSSDGRRSPTAVKGGDNKESAKKHERGPSHDWNWTEKIVGKGDASKKK